MNHRPRGTLFIESAHSEVGIATASLQQSIFKLAIAGEQAGLTVEQMIQMLNAGLTVEGLLQIIELRIGSHPERLSSSRWVM